MWSETTKHRATPRSSFASSKVNQIECSLHVPSQVQDGEDDEGEEPLQDEEEPLEDGEINKEPSTSETATLVPKPSDHPIVFGKDVQGRILEEIIESFIIKRGTKPPRIPLCRLMENEAIRAV